MPGGPRAGSGPKPDPRSANSERRGTATLLPADGYRGPIPDFPIPDARPRDLELWSWAWSTPQAARWALEPWRQYDVARWCRAATDYEQPNPAAATRSDVNSLADRIGLSEAGLRFNGWTMASAEEPRAERAATTSTRTSSRARMTILTDDDHAASRSA